MSAQVLGSGGARLFAMPATCATGSHVGPFLRTEKYAAVDGWAGFGDCAACGSTVWVGARSVVGPCAECGCVVVEGRENRRDRDGALLCERCPVGVAA